MPSIKDVDKLIINTVENETVYKYMEDNNLLQEDELYLVAGDSLPPITEEDNGKVLGVTNGEWQVVDQTSPLTPGTDYLTPTQISNSYVAKVNGKGLSTNDLTNELKSQYDKAEQNVQSDWDETNTSSDAYILNKPNIPTKMSDLEQDVETGKIDAIKVNNVAQTITNKTVNISVPTTLSQLTGDTTHRLVTDTEKSTWNNKSDFNGSYNALTDKPTIPTALSQLSGDATHRTVTDEQITKWNNSEIPDEYVYADELVDSNITGNPLDAGTLGGYSASDFQLKSQMPAVPTKVSQLSNDRGYVTNTELPAVPRFASQLINDSGFITNELLNNTLVPIIDAQATADNTINMVYEEALKKAVIITTEFDFMTGKYALSKTPKEVYELHKAGIPVFIACQTPGPSFDQLDIYALQFVQHIPESSGGPLYACRFSHLSGSSSTDYDIAAIDEFNGTTNPNGEHFWSRKFFSVRSSRAYYIDVTSSGSSFTPINDYMSYSQVKSMVSGQDLIIRDLTTGKQIPMTQNYNNGSKFIFGYDEQYIYSNDSENMTIKRNNNIISTSSTTPTVPANTSYTTAQLRNVIISTADPSGGSNGDIWIKYEA